MDKLIIWQYDLWYVKVINYNTTKNLGIVMNCFPKQELLSIDIENLKYGEIAIWDFDDTEGILDVLVESEVVDSPHYHISTKSKDTTYLIPVVRLSKKFTDIISHGAVDSDQVLETTTQTAKPADNN